MLSICYTAFKCENTKVKYGGSVSKMCYQHTYRLPVGMQQLDIQHKIELSQKG